MTSEDIDMFRQVQPDEALFPCYPDRESPWLLAYSMGETARVADLKRSSLAPLLNRPWWRPLEAWSDKRTC